MSLICATPYVIEQSGKMFQAYDTASTLKRMCIRIGSAGIACAILIAGIADLALGTVSTALCVVTGGSKKKLNEIMKTELRHGGNILSNISFAALRVINPSAIITTDREEGILAAPLIECLSEIKHCFFKSDVFLVREVVSRLTVILAVPIIAAAWLIDTAIGVAALAFAIIMMGESEKMNTIAYNALKGGGHLYTTVLQHVVLFVNPFPEAHNHQYLSWSTPITLLR